MNTMNIHSVIVNSKFVKRHSKGDALHRAPAYS